MDLATAVGVRDISIRSLNSILNLALQAQKGEIETTSFAIRYESVERVYRDLVDAHRIILADIVQSNREATPRTSPTPELDKENVILSRCEDIYYSIKTIYHSLFQGSNPLAPASPVAQNMSFNIAQSSGSSNVRLPKISLPSFSGNLKDWPAFIDLFSSLVDNNGNLSNIEKFQYLLTSLEREPLHLVKALPISNSNYPIALETLKKRYQNKRLLASSYLESIINCPSVSNESSRSFRNLIDTFAENLSALKDLAFPVDSWDFILLYLLLNKIDLNTRREFETKFAKVEVPSYKDLEEFLNDHSKMLESIGVSGKRDRSRNLSSFLIKTETNQSCPLCKKSHSLMKCFVFLSKNSFERFSIVKDLKCCLICFGSNHYANSCKSRCCSKCNGKHNTLLHFDSKSSQIETNNSGEQNATVDSQPVNALSTFTSSSTVLLSTAVVEVFDSQGRLRKVRALLDSASEASFITENCLKILGIKKLNSSTPINCLGQAKSTTSGLTNLKLKVPFGDLHIEAFVVTKICSDMPSSPIIFDSWPHITNIRLADPKFNEPHSIDILLGAGIFPHILKEGRLSGGKNLPVALDTVFGWVLMGRVNQKQSKTIHSFHCSIDIDTTLKQFWELEEVPFEQVESPENKFAEKHFIDTHRRDPSGRFVVGLPFRNNIKPIFENSREIALKRFYSLESKLIKNPNLASSYREFMSDYLSSSHMEIVEPCFDTCAPVYYIPHHGVFKDDSLTTKLRVVFDASSKDAHNLSLNDSLLPGPKLQKDIFQILMRFRLNLIAFSADIKQMYRQILLEPSERDFQRILWRPSPDKPVVDYRLNTVTYGVSSSPFLALRTMRALADAEHGNFPRASAILKTDMYVDDILSGSDTIEGALSLKTDLIELCRSGGFELRKWCSNCSELSSLKEEHIVNDSSNLTVKVLGLKWSPNSDHFCFDIVPLDVECTKRKILSELARIFDPLGFLTPLTFFAKYMIQHLWILGLGWDDKPPIDILNTWFKYKSQLAQFKNLKIPRFLSINKTCCVDLHGFCDASEKGYAAVIYSRISDRQNDVVFVSLLCAKSRVAPVKKISIPRLELCGAQLLAKLLKIVLETYINIVQVEGVFAWSDSQIVLSWINSSPHLWKTFVSNRVSYIQTTVPTASWNHVSTHENPADCASRGLLPSDLVDCKIWWNGPQFLHQSNIELSKPFDGTINESSSNFLSEKRRIALVTQISVDFLDKLLDKCSSLLKIQRILVYCLRFGSRNKLSDSPSRPIGVSELHQALLCLIKYVQRVSFPQDIKKLEEKEPISAKWLRRLNGFLDERGLLRVGGRLVNSRDLSYDRKFPLLLPNSCRLTDLIIEHFHRLHLHIGLQGLHFLLGQQFWILGPKRAIRRCLSKCLKCFRVNPNPYQPKMGNLPAFRISQLKPFQCVGVDFGGPFIVKAGSHRGAKTQKAYICLFICFAVKAIHIELVSDLSSEAFLAAFRRFVARRGRCVKVFSDRGTNFVGAYKMLQQFLEKTCDSEVIEWHFNPPSAPHFGGLWEAGIKSVKTHLNRVIGEQILTFEEFYTVLVQIESVLNSRPLCSVSSDPNDLSVLTPGHFLTLEPLSCLPDDDLSHEKIARLNRWQLLQRLHQDFWKRWKDEYLHTLHQRTKWDKDLNCPIEVGTMVLIKNELFAPLRWKIGRVVRVVQGADGIARVAEVRTSSGILQRPLTKLCPLPNQ